MTDRDRPETGETETKSGTGGPIRPGPDLLDD